MLWKQYIEKIIFTGCYKIYIHFGIENCVYEIVHHHFSDPSSSHQQHSHTLFLSNASWGWIYVYMYMACHGITINLCIVYRVLYNVHTSVVFQSKFMAQSKVIILNSTHSHFVVSIGIVFGLNHYIVVYNPKKLIICTNIAFGDTFRRSD